MKKTLMPATRQSGPRSGAGIISGPGAANSISVVEIDASKISSLPSLSRVVVLSEGLHALIIGPIARHVQSIAGIALPATIVVPGPSEDYAPVDITLNSGEIDGWLDAGGGTVVASVPHGGGIVVVTSYGIADAADLPQFQLLSLDGRRVASEIVTTPIASRAASTTQSVPVKRELDIEITTHIERLGDQQMLADNWVGRPGQRLRIEAFGVRPLGELRPGDIEYMAYGPDGRQTPWVTDAKLCGTRGRGLPLTGFAIRLMPAVRERYDVIYEGSFFAGGTIGPRRNGEPCVAQMHDSLEAMRVRIIRRHEG